jgi:hypothetical protein
VRHGGDHRCDDDPVHDPWGDRRARLPHALIRDLFADQSFEIHGGWLFTRGLSIGLVLVVLWTLINVFIVFLYNLLSDVVGGIEVTLSERR